jgi:hypothetical protein
MILLKTHQSHMDAVRKNRKHATDGIPQHVSPGDFLLIQVTSGSPGNETRRVRYAMRFKRCYEDTTGECKRIFGETWRYIIEGERDTFRILRSFDIENVQVSAANYGQGVIRFAYVDPAYETEILRRGLLEGV